MKLIEEMRTVMKEKNLSPEQICKFIGCSGRQIRRWLEGKSRPSQLSKNAIRMGLKKIKRAERDRQKRGDTE